MPLRHKLVFIIECGIVVVMLLLAAGIRLLPNEAVRAGPLNRDDTIAYLILSDQLRNFAGSKTKVVACISAWKGEEGRISADPSGALLAQLLRNHDSLWLGDFVRPISACDLTGPSIIDKESGRRAFVVYVGRSHPNACEPYIGGWHGGPLHGGANYYAVRDGEVVLDKSETCFLFE